MFPDNGISVNNAQGVNGEGKGFEGYAVLSLMGGKIIAGYVTKVYEFGIPWIHVKFLARDGEPAFERNYNNHAVYGWNECTKAEAQRVTDETREPKIPSQRRKD